MKYSPTEAGLHRKFRISLDIRLPQENIFLKMSLLSLGKKQIYGWQLRSFISSFFLMFRNSTHKGELRRIFQHLICGPIYLLNCKWIIVFKCDWFNVGFSSNRANNSRFSQKKKCRKHKICNEKINKIIIIK